MTRREAMLVATAPTVLPAGLSGKGRDGVTVDEFRSSLGMKPVGSVFTARREVFVVETYHTLQEEEVKKLKQQLRAELGPDPAILLLSHGLKLTRV